MRSELWSQRVHHCLPAQLQSYKAINGSVTKWWRCMVSTFHTGRNIPDPFFSRSAAIPDLLVLFLGNSSNNWKHVTISQLRPKWMKRFRQHNCMASSLGNIIRLQRFTQFGKSITIITINNHTQITEAGGPVSLCRVAKGGILRSVL